MEHHVNFTLKAPYVSLNDLKGTTKSIWIIFHGYGQLAEHFIKRFDTLNPDENFIVAPQGLSRFYLQNGFDRVGATWMTKEDRLTELENQKSYFSAVLNDAFGKVDLSHYQVNFLGFSQGVSMMARMAVYTQLPLAKMIVWAGSFPPELKVQDFDFLPSTMELKILLGDKDEYFTNKRYQKEIDMMENILLRKPQITLFDGKHEVKRVIVKSL